MAHVLLPGSVHLHRQRRIAAVVVVAALVLVSTFSGILSDATSQDPDFVADVASALASWLAFLACLYAATVTTGPARRSWALFATTMGLWAGADSIWLSYADASGSHALVSAADYLYLIGIVPVALGMVSFPAGTWEPGARSRLMLDVGVLGSSLLLCSHLLVLDEVSAQGWSLWDTVLTEIYPVTDVLLASLAVLLLIRTAGRPRLDLALITLALIVWTATDNGYALLSVRDEAYTGTAVAIGYIAAPLLLGFGALASPTASLRQRTIRRHLTGTVSSLLPDLAVLLGVTVVAIRGLETWQDWTLAAVGLTLVATRQLVISASNHSMRLNLEGQVESRTDQLRQLAERHSSILEAVGEGIIGVDEHGRIAFVNPAAALMLGWTAADLEGRDACATLCHERHDHCVVEMVLAVGDVVHQAETTYTRRNHSTLPVEIMAAPRKGPHGPAGAVIAFRDITERQAMDRLKREFVSAVSHELRTPLTAIRGSLEMLYDGDTGDLPPGSMRAVEMAMRGSERLTRLVNDILDIERLDTGAFSISPVSQDLAPLVEGTLASMRDLAAAHGVTLIGDDVAGRALCDADRFVQALTNLLGNAIKFTPVGGRVVVTACPGPHEVMLTVRDEGRGIPPEHLDAIFDRFHQVEEADLRDKGGTGLGLPITKSIIERHGGQIAVESKPGIGSTFRFSLPLGRD